jgi:transposase
MCDDTTVFVGLDVHKDSIAVAMILDGAEAPVVDYGTIGTQRYAVQRLIRNLSDRGARPVFVYEAGPCGFRLHRLLIQWGYRCLVVAPSLVPKRPGVRIKTDRRDARQLAMNLKAGTLTAVHIPSPTEEAFRDVVRAWHQAKWDVTKAKQRLAHFLLRNDIRYTGKSHWTPAHRRWLSELVLPSAAQQIVFQELVMAVDERERRRDRLEDQLDQLAPDWPGYALAQALQAFRGLQKTVAYTVLAEACDLRRFGHPRHFMAWLGLIPAEHSSGSKRRQGSITRSGNRWARTMLIEAAWAYRYSPKVSRIIQLRQEQVPAPILDIAWQAQLRLHKKYRRLIGRGVNKNKVITAVARELAGFIWASAREPHPADPYRRAPM